MVSVRAREVETDLTLVDSQFDQLGCGERDEPRAVHPLGPIELKGGRWIDVYAWRGGDLRPPRRLNIPLPAAAGRATIGGQSRQGALEFARFLVQDGRLRLLARGAHDRVLTENVWGRAIRRVGTGEASPGEAVDDAILRINEILAE